jgi:uncharacterized protein (UPF0218 family)
VVLTLPEELRGAFKQPLGPVFADARELLAASENPIVAIGDVVSYHLMAAGRTPDVAVLDGYTERTPIDEDVREGIDADAFDERLEARNPAAALTTEVLAALADALAGTAPTESPGDAESTASDESTASAEYVGGTGSTASTGSTVIDVGGEEDLVTLPAIAAAPENASVVYGQPGEGMVRVPVDGETRRRARDLIERMNGDHERTWAILGVSAE